MTRASCHTNHLSIELLLNLSLGLLRQHGPALCGFAFCRWSPHGLLAAAAAAVGPLPGEIFLHQLRPSVFVLRLFPDPLHCLWACAHNVLES